MNSDKLVCLIKFCKREFAEKLLKRGELYFNLPEMFNASHNPERGDINEGAEWIDNTPIIKIKVEHPTIGIMELKGDISLPSRVIQYNYFFRSFSMYAITYAHFENNNTHSIDSRMSEFGDTAIIIEDPYRFLNSIISKFKMDGIQYETRPVIYSEVATGKVNLTPFDKKIEHQHQCEFRIIIENTNNVAGLITIGSIEEYSKLVDSKTILECLWTAKRNPTNNP